MEKASWGCSGEAPRYLWRIRVTEAKGVDDRCVNTWSPQAGNIERDIRVCCGSVPISAHQAVDRPLIDDHKHLKKEISSAWSLGLSTDAPDSPTTDMVTNSDTTMMGVMNSDWWLQWTGNKLINLHERNSLTGVLEKYLWARGGGIH